MILENYHNRSPDKFSLLKSAALYNAALIRSPDNAEIEYDLEQLCKLILREADAARQNADMRGKSKEIKNIIVNWRSKIQDKLSEINQVPDVLTSYEAHHLEIKKIYDIQSLQNKIATDYTEIMADIAAYCEDVMGEAP